MGEAELAAVVPGEDSLAVAFGAGPLFAVNLGRSCCAKNPLAFECVFRHLCVIPFRGGSRSAFVPLGSLLVYQRTNTVKKFLRWLISTAFMYPLLKPIFELKGAHTMGTPLQMPADAESPRPGQFFVNVLVEVVNCVVALIAH
ncbi:MAG: hypothetical protein U9N84_03950 [Actinomycetota bacterium]|nr:hypothetical protein [Actinomycetota bacterium]